MFIKECTQNTKNSKVTYLHIVKSYRTKDGKIKHKYIASLGRKDELIAKGSLESIAKRLVHLIGKYILLDKSQQQLELTLNYGSVYVLDNLWKRLKLDKIFGDIQKEYKIEFDLAKAVKLMVLNRIADPKSKLGIQSWRETIYDKEFEGVELQHLYRALDILAEQRSILKRELYNTTLRLFKPDVSVVFCDLTTLYFESQREDEIRRYGYSKDNKTDCVQVVMGLVLDGDGFPIDYEIFEGNTAEAKAVMPMVERLKADYNIKQVVFVADSGVMSKELLDKLERQGYKYIISARIKKLPEEARLTMLDKTNYVRLSDNIRYKELEYNGKRLVVCYSEKKAVRDRKMREALVERLQEQIKRHPKGVLTKSPYRAYLKMDVKGIALDEQKIQQQAQYDGYYGFSTNAKELSAKQVIAQYKLLWQIEASFRCLKSTLKIRPIYHWTKKRIHGHLMMCFLSLYVLQAMQKLLKQKGLELSTQQMQRMLEKIQVTKVRMDNTIYFIRNKITGEQAKLLSALGMKLPPVIINEEQISKEQQRSPSKRSSQHKTP